MSSNSPAVVDSGHERQDGFIIAVSVLVGLGSITVLMRLVWRQFFMRNLGLDDMFMFLAWVFTIGYLAEIVVLLQNKLGHNIEEMSLANMTIFLKVTLALEVTYYCIVYFIKVSIIYLYLRIAISKSMRKLCYGTIGVLTAFWVICIIVTMAQCTPFHKTYDVTRTVAGQCINTTAFFYTTSAFNIITDFWILWLPIRTLWSIQRPAQEKVAIVVIFGMGIFSSAAAIIRLHTIYRYTLSTDPFRDGIPINLWSMIEVNIAMICASLPSLKQVLSYGKRSRNTTNANYNSGSGGDQIRTIGQMSNQKKKVISDGDHSINMTSLSIKSNHSNTERHPNGRMLEGENPSTEQILDPEDIPSHYRAVAT